MRISGDYPAYESLKLEGKEWGEWRAQGKNGAGHQTIIYGVHPSGVRYTNNGKRPIEIAFDEIKWPEGIELPWQRKEPSLYERLTATYGAPLFQAGKTAPIKINQMFFVARFAEEHIVIHEPGEHQFYVYDPECGIWSVRSLELIKATFSDDWKQYADEIGKPAFIPLRTNRAPRKSDIAPARACGEAQRLPTHATHHPSHQWDASPRQRS